MVVSINFRDLLTPFLEEVVQFNQEHPEFINFDRMPVDDLSETGTVREDGRVEVILRPSQALHLWFREYQRLASVAKGWQ